jgi:hypothetical protein
LSLSGAKTLDRAAWLADRKRMFRPGLHVEAVGATSREDGDLVVLTFEQDRKHADLDRRDASQGVEPRRLPADLESFLGAWLSSQNETRFNDYASLYADGFHGVKRTDNGTTRADPMT